ncbi:hypothetical protein DBW_2921 [Desulfuromonas sp. DDH964]|nr:hypothetical protein DBW_2921 [Desulfuromonas sp. DDH964]
MMPTIISRLGIPFLLLMFLTGCLGPRPVLELGDAVISGTERWSGEVRIRGVVTVRKEGALEITPGTRVVFLPYDMDQDGIGDSELRVEGALSAVGTARHPILFTSGAARPAPADWKFIYCDFARSAELEHIISEYAYSGVQVHFCKARIVNSEFRYNVDGVRFSTVNIEVAGNDIHHNTYGIRYEERRSTGTVHHNRIDANDVGIFAVTRCANGVQFRDNDLAGNRSYHVKLGAEQRQDLSFPRNWWGATDPAAIAARFFDRRYDATLGAVTAPDPLAAPAGLSW